ncbi:hypothetical protein F0562_028610 [Nyssa sinensis]|uniref:BZIP domain-containing protein n=1 Tax=Nyssa sinensis TaxID=561372 RepID=A0A5J5B2S8_9ASTE|nr:hypothetical protein F0562_028610 [Nyssa sinensis]
MMATGDVSAQYEDELKRQRKRSLNRESARRSRISREEELKQICEPDVISVLEAKNPAQNHQSIDNQNLQVDIVHLLIRILILRTPFLRMS